MAQPQQPRILATCETCRERKVRCNKRRQEDAACINCQRRGNQCVFRMMRQRRPVAAQKEVGQPSSSAFEGSDVATEQSQPGTAEWHDGATGPSPRRPHSPYNDHFETSGATGNSMSLCIDRILNQGSCARHFDLSIVVTSNDYVPSSTLAFFSEEKIKSLSKQLGNDNIRKIIHQIDENAAGRLKAFKNLSATSLTTDYVTDDDLEGAPSYITAYFDNIHPLYPFLDRQKFEELSQRHVQNDALREDVAWSALYYGVLCLGSMYCDGGSFLPQQGISWRFFIEALKRFSELLLVRRTLRTAQALTVMAIFGQTFAALPLDETPITEAARIALSLGIGRGPRHGDSLQESSRVFWVIYCMEKDFAFNVTRSSIINDHDVACILPSMTPGDIQHLDWIKCWATFSRILSKAYESLFSLSANLLDDMTICARIEKVTFELDRWRDSVPLQLRPGHPIQPHKLGNSVSITLAVKIHFYYYNLQIALSRLFLRKSRGIPTADGTSSKRALLTAARSTIETLNFIEIEPFTAGWILAHVPCVATFILFDFIIHNPYHQETEKNLALLHVAAGYFNRFYIHLHHARPIEPMIELINIANEFVINSRNNKIRSHGTTQSGPSVHHRASPIQETPTSVETPTAQVAPDFTDGAAQGLIDDSFAFEDERWPELESIESLAYPIDLSLFIDSSFQSLMPSSSADTYDLASYLFPKS